jgi:hypothetical protein
MSSAPPRFLITLGFALVVIGTALGLLFFLQRPTQFNSRGNGANSRTLTDEQKIAEAERRIFASVPEKQAAYEKAFTELNSAGMVRSASLPTRESLHEREEMVKRFDDANTALEEVFKNAEATLRSELLKQDFSEYTSAKVAARFAERANVELILKIRACDRESNLAFLQLLDLLDAHWGAWKPSAEDRLIFNKTADANAYNALRQRIVEIGATQQSAQAEVQQRIHDAGDGRPHP